MGKKNQYVGRLCIYCGKALSAAGDHVVSREFFPVDLREGIPIVPACKPCNTKKSKLEQYLMTVLPFASNHPVSQRMMLERVPRHFAGNRKLHRAVRRGAERIWVSSKSGLVVPSLSLPFEPEQARAYFSMVAQGLLFHHFHSILGEDYSSEAHAVTDSGVAKFEHEFWPPGATRVVKNELAAGALKYKGRGSEEEPRRSVWLIELYGGLTMRGAGKDEGASAGRFFAVTARRKMFEEIRLASKFAI